VCKWHKRSSSTTVYDQWSYRRIHRERKALSDDGHLGANLLSDVKKCINNIKWLYHINAMLHCYHSRNHLKAHRCYLVSYFSTGPSILATLMQPGRQRINTFPYAVNRKRGICTYVYRIYLQAQLVFLPVINSTQTWNGVTLRHRGGHSVGRPRENQRL